MASDDRDVTDILFSSPAPEGAQEPGSSTTSGRHRHLPLVVACVSWMVAVSARLVVQRVNANSFQAPWWVVVVAGLVVFAAVHRAWSARRRAVPVLVAQTVAMISLLPLVDLALPIPAAILVAASLTSRPLGTE